MTNSERPESRVGKAIVVGDLSLDSVAHTLTGQTFADLQSGHDATVAGSVRMLVGGTAYLFSRAILEITDLEPIVMAGIGDDFAGRCISAAFDLEGMTTRGIVIQQVPTAMYGTTYFDDGQRLMICPADNASQHYALATAKLLTEALGDDPVAMLWVSGYGLLHHREPNRRLAAIVYMCQWARGRGVPIAVDLVPHKFAEQVGSVDDVISWLGPVDVLVADLDTAVRLAGMPEGAGSADPQVAAAAAGTLGAGSRCVITQYRSGPSTYRQTIAPSRPGNDTETVDYPIRDGQLRGIGDRLAVTGLCQIGLLGAAC